MCKIEVYVSVCANARQMVRAVRGMRYGSMAVRGNSAAKRARVAVTVAAVRVT